LGARGQLRRAGLGGGGWVSAGDLEGQPCAHECSRSRHGTLGRFMSGAAGPVGKSLRRRPRQCRPPKRRIKGGVRKRCRLARGRPKPRRLLVGRFGDADPGAPTTWPRPTLRRRSVRPSWKRDGGCRVGGAWKRISGLPFAASSKCTRSSWISVAARKACRASGVLPVAGERGCSRLDRQTPSRAGAKLVAAMRGALHIEARFQSFGAEGAWDAIGSSICRRGLGRASSGRKDRHATRRAKGRSARRRVAAGVVEVRVGL